MAKSRKSYYELFQDFLEGREKNEQRILEQVVLIAVEIAREGREGRKIGTIFVVFDSQAVLSRSKNLILDPLKGHDDHSKCIDHPDMRETIKELSQLDGAFVVSDQGVVVSACRYLNASSEGIDLPMGLGSRHMAAASITRDTKSVAVVVSESSVVRIFEKGQLISEIIPEFWMLDYHGHRLSGKVSERTDRQLTVVSATQICGQNKKNGDLGSETK